MSVNLALLSTTASRACRAGITAFALGAASAPAAAQSDPAAAEIIIVAERVPPGANPDRVVQAADVATYGLNNVGELLDELMRARGGNDEAPVYLINGRLVSGISDIDSYPVEAVERVEILPAGAGLIVGASGARSVINIILKKQVRTGVGLAGVSFAGRSGTGGNGEINLTDIRRPRRINLTVKTRSDSAIRESDRGVIQPVGSAPDLGRLRTLRPELDKTEIKFSAADRLAGLIDAALDARWTDSQTRSLLGVDSLGSPLERLSRSRTSAIGLQLDGEIGEWLIGFSGDFDRARRRTMTGVAGAAALASRTRAKSSRVSGDLRAAGPVAQLPAGPLSLTLRAGLSRDELDGGDDRFRQSAREVGASVQLPIASRAAGVLAPLGELSAGVELSRSKVSGIGSLSNATYSLQWQPVDWLSISGSLTTGRSPPSLALTADPLLETPGVRYVDPLSGETVEVVQLTGGNPALRAQRTASRRLSLSVKPLAKVPLTLTSEYLASGNRDFIASLPAAGELLLLAFPERFGRNADGVLERVDARPISFARRRDVRLRSGLELELPFGGRDGRVQLSASHSWLRKSQVQIRSDLAPVDQLSSEGPAIDGNQPRHQLEFSAGYASRGLGFRLLGSHRSKSFLNLADAEGSEVLRFSALTTFGLRAFIDGSRLLPDTAWMRGARLSLSVQNIGGSRERIEDKLGRTPLAYQPAYRDPLGRTVAIEFRNIF